MTPNEAPLTAVEDVMIEGGGYINENGMASSGAGLGLGYEHNQLHRV